MGAAAHPGSRLQVRVRLPWRLARVRRVRVTSLAVDTRGLWRAGTSDGGRYRLYPDRIWQGGWGWLTIAGPVWALAHDTGADQRLCRLSQAAGATDPCSSGRVSRATAHGVPRRLSVTVWAHQVSPARWRRLKVAAQWWMQRAQAMPAGAGEAP